MQTINPYMLWFSFNLRKTVAKCKSGKISGIFLRFSKSKKSMKQLFLDSNFCIFVIYSPSSIDLYHLKSKITIKIFVKKSKFSWATPFVFFQILGWAHSRVSISKSIHVIKLILVLFFSPLTQQSIHANN